MHDLANGLTAHDAMLELVNVVPANRHAVKTASDWVVNCSFSAGLGVVLKSVSSLT